MNNESQSWGELLGAIAGVLAFLAAYLFIIWGIFYLLWNWIAAGIFGLPELTFWQCVGLGMLLGFIGGLFSGLVSKD